MAIKSEVLLRITGDGSDAEKALNGVRKQLTSLSSTAIGVGTALTKFVTLPLAGLGAASFAAAADFEQAMTGVAKTVDVTADELAALGDELQRLSEEEKRGFGASELARIAELGGQLGRTKDTLADFVSVIADLDVSTDLGAEQAALELSQFSNVMQTAEADFRRIGSTVVELGNNSATTESRIVSMAQRIARGGAAAGLSETEVLGFAAAVASAGVEAEAGGTAISRVFAEIATAAATGGENLDVMARIAGQTSAQFRETFSRSAADAVRRFVEGLGRAQQAGENVFQLLEATGFNDVRVREALLGIARSGDLLADSLDTASRAWEENTALTAEAEKFYATLRNEFKSLLAEAKNLAADLGAELAPAFRLVIATARGLLDVLRALVELFAALPRPVKIVAIGLAGLAAAAGPLIGLVGALAGAMALLATPAGAGALAAVITQVGLLAPLLAAGGVLAVGLTVVTAGFVSWRKATRAQQQALAEFRDGVAALPADLSDADAIRAALADKEAQFTRNLAEIGNLQARLAEQRAEGLDRIASSTERRIAFLRSQNAALSAGLQELRDTIRDNQTLPGVSTADAEAGLAEVGEAAAAATHDFQTLAEQAVRLNEAQRELAEARTAARFAGTATAAAVAREEVRRLRAEIQALRAQLVFAPEIPDIHPALNQLRAREEALDAARREAVVGATRQARQLAAARVEALEVEIATIERLQDQVGALALGFDPSLREFDTPDQIELIPDDQVNRATGSLDQLGIAALRTQESLAEAFGQRTVDIFVAFGDALAGAFSNIQGAFRGLLGAVLGILGDLMIQAGTMIIATSKAFEAFKASLVALIPAGGIAAGALLIAAGAAFKGAAGAFLSNPTGAGGGGSAAAPAFADAGAIAGERRRGTVIFEGEPFLDMTNPRTREKLGEAIRELGDLDELVIRFS